MNKLLAMLLAVQCSLFTLLSSAVPIHWTVETSRVQPAQFEGYHGETIEFAAALQTYGKPLAITNDLIGIYWQTNGMGSAYWTAPAVLSNNVMIARWTPEMDVGANVYSCFIGAPGEIYRAAFQLRLRPSPGAVPSELPLPVETLDFAQVQVLNAPYYSKSETDARIIELSPPADLSPAFAYTTAVSNKLESSKQAVIEDLDTIRSGAALGATAVQPSAISDMETKTHAAATYLPMADPTIAGAYLEWDGGRLKLRFGDFYAEWINVDGANIGGKSIWEIMDEEIDSMVPGYMWDFQESIYNTPTNLAGYGITDAKIENGTITLGSQSITPLTSFTESDPTVAAKIDNTVTTAFIRERLGVYLYVGEDGGIYVHTGEE